MKTLACCLILLAIGCGTSTPQPFLQKACQLKVELDAELGSSAPTLLLVDEEALISHPFVPSASGFTATVELPPGFYEYFIKKDQVSTIDVDNPLRVEHPVHGLVSYIDLNRCDTPEFRFVQRTERSLDLVLERADSGGQLIGRGLRATIGDEQVAINRTGDHVYVDIAGLEVGKHRLQLEGTTTAGQAVSFNGSFWIEAKPFDWSETTMYQIVVDRFSADFDFGPRERAIPPGQRVGGHLNGVLRKLESGYFDELGIGALWLSPLYENANGLWVGVEGGDERYESYHGYWPTSARRLAPEFGDETTFERLIEAAHRRGIRVILDVVPNHVHRDHEYYRDHPEWFDATQCICGSPACPWWRDIDRCWFTEYLPDVQWTAPGVLDRMTDDMVWWLERFNLDGLRVDAVPMMPRYVIRHLSRKVSERIETLDARVYLLGETYTGPDDYDAIRYPLGPNGLDGQFDFPLMWAIRNALAWQTDTIETLFDRWTRSQDAWRGSASVMATIIGNHDVTRFATEANGGWHWGDPWRQPAIHPISSVARERHELALGFMLTMPGLPLIYYGDEYGEVGGSDPDNRRPMRFGLDLTTEERGTLGFVGRLTRLRKCHPALHRGGLEPLRISAEAAIYRRFTASGDDAFVRLSRDVSKDQDWTPPTGYINALAALEPPESSASVARGTVFEVWVAADSDCL